MSTNFDKQQVAKKDLERNKWKEMFTEIKEWYQELWVQLTFVAWAFPFALPLPLYIVGKKRDPGILDPEHFLAQIRKVEARLGKLAKIRKVETD